MHDAKRGNHQKGKSGMKRGNVVSMDLGGTNVRLGIVDSTGRVLRRQRTRMARFTSKDDLCDWLGTAIGDFIAANAGLARPRAVAIGFAGPTKSEAGVVHYAPNVGRFTHIDVARRLERALGLPVVVENDANCAALGEFWRGRGRGAKSLFLFTLGTGIGGSLLIDGRVWHGADGIAGEIGHTIVASGGPRCSCGRLGCLEALVSATAIVRDYREAAGRRGGPAGEVTAKQVVDLARAGDRVAGRVLKRSACALGIGIANVFHLLNPEIILIGGGVSRAGAILLQPAIAEARSLVFPPLADRVKVRRTSLGDDAGILGAAYLGLGL
jgi:glucokinase